LTVSLGKTAIPQDDQNGWSFADSAHASITLSGSACDQYVGSQYNKISVGYTCSPCGGPNACPQQWQ